MTLFLKRFGTGAFDYDFGALDETDNQLTKSYMNVMYDHLYWYPRFKVPVTLTTCSILQLCVLRGSLPILHFLDVRRGMVSGIASMAMRELQ